MDIYRFHIIYDTFVGIYFYRKDYFSEIIDCDNELIDTRCAF
ncbi:hypothetical protein J3D55_003378 [Chryseobacterium ginsenosidimutans]|nr:hypothetical protein [Chryseobacterium ginsenosidimutans]MCS3870462.1 hypothetical protein [Chryseobacterium ginsenosidimutans]